MDSNAQARRLLYEDEAGEYVGLAEVQLLDPPLRDRVPALRELAEGAELATAIEAALVLTAWGEPDGLRLLHRFLDEQVHRSGCLFPDRVEGHDNVYDEFAFAAQVHRLGDGSIEEYERLIGRLLAQYGTCRFRSHLKGTLLMECPAALLPQVLTAIERALDLGLPYLASQLVPVLAKWAPEQVQPHLERCLRSVDATPNPQANAAEALGYLPRAAAEGPLRSLCRHADPAVVAEAEQSLAKVLARG